jgi:hypothetical protein
MDLLLSRCPEVPALQEMARQMGLRADVAVLPSGGPQGDKECLVQVYTDGGTTMLVDPYRGVPLVDPASGEALSLAALTARPEAYGSLLRLGEISSAYQADMFKAAELKAAVDPQACYPRFLVFDHLLSVLPAHPCVGFQSAALPEGQKAELWTAPVEILDRMASKGYAEQAAKAYAAMTSIREARATQLGGAYGSAAEKYGAVLADLKNTLAQTEIKETGAMLTEALEVASFFAAVNAYDGGDGAQAERQLRDYLAQYPSGRWRVLATVILGEELLAAGDKAGAKALWDGLPEPRKLYAALRLRGLMPGAAPSEQHAEPAVPAAGERAPGAQATSPSPGAPARPAGAPSP